LKEAVEVAHNGVVLGGWKTSTMTDYLRVHGLNEEAIQNVKHRANNCKKYNAVICACNGDITAPSFDALHKEKKVTHQCFRCGSVLQFGVGVLTSNNISMWQCICYFLVL
jgi:hypothetical protein